QHPHPGRRGDRTGFGPRQADLVLCSAPGLPVGQCEDLGRAGDIEQVGIGEDRDDDAVRNGHAFIVAPAPRGRNDGCLSDPATADRGRCSLLRTSGQAGRPARSGYAPPGGGPREAESAPDRPAGTALRSGTAPRTGARSLLRVRIVWTTDPGDDPRLLRVLPRIRAGAVAGAVLGGVPVYVTATGPHYDGDCPRAGEHDCAAAAVQAWDAATGEPVRSVSGAGGRLLAVASVCGRPVAAVCDEDGAPQLVDLEAGAVLGRLPGHRGAVRAMAAAELEAGPAVLT